MNQDPESPWPVQGQRLWGTTDSDDQTWFLNACFFTDRDIDLYAYGYREAAHRLLESVVASHGKVDVLIYPFVFCWRQYLELRLKKVIWYGNVLENSDEGFPPTHDILRLWRGARLALETIAEDLPEYDAIAGVVQEFAAADPDSFAFRYPMKKDGTATVPPETPNLNWGQFHKAMSGVANFLDAAQCELDQRVEYMMEATAEASRNAYP
jgi:hypothetical protein